MSTKTEPRNPLILNGSQLSNDGMLPEIVIQFKDALSSSADSPVELDLSKLKVIYSKGISLVLGLYKDCKATNREFSILVTTDDIFNLFKMLKLDKVISIRKVTQ